MASRDELLALLSDATEDEPIPVLLADLDKLTADDLLAGTRLEPCSSIEGSTRQLALEGTLMRGSSTPLVALMEESIWRKGWNLPLGSEDYAALVAEAVRQRERTRGDVEFVDSMLDENMIFVTYSISLGTTDLRAGVEWARATRSELLEAAEAVTAGVEDLVAAAEKRLQGWGTEPFDILIDRMREGTAHEKGVALEELTSRLFNTVPGFSATGRLLTATEEIDTRIQNATDDPYWRQESYMLLAECKNWSGKCGKDEFVLFKSKLSNRVGRVTCGFLISWNGFAETVTKEMLRGSEGNLLVVPIEGSDLRAAVHDGDFPERLKALHDRAVFL